jgi:hypothetical protein
MEEKLIAPCGMNCALCVNYQAQVHDLNAKGFHKALCPGCIPRGKNCAFLKQRCELLGNGLVRYCFECVQFPCQRLKDLDRRYIIRYHMSMIDNLNTIRAHGMDPFLLKQAEKWRCPKCGGTICCHNGLCLNCDLDRLRENKKYCWNEKNIAD